MLIVRSIVNQDTTLARHSHPGGMTRAWTHCLHAMLHGVNAVAIPMPRLNLLLARPGTNSTALSARPSNRFGRLGCKTLKLLQLVVRVLLPILFGGVFAATALVLRMIFMGTWNRRPPSKMHKQQYP